MEGTAETPVPRIVAGRPTRRMTWRELFQISVYWLAINAMWGALDLLILPDRMTTFVCGGLSGAGCQGHEQAIFDGIVVSKEIATAILAFAGALVALLVQPTAAAVSDYTKTRWGRRKPYIFIGTILDVVFLAGLASSNTFLAVFAFIVLLQFSSNFAQGPFQGYVPDLVPASQVGIASGLMGVMVITGNFVGIGAAAIAIALGDFRLGIAAVAILELTTMLVTVLTVREPPGVAPPRKSRTLGGAVRNTLRDVVSHRSFLWLLGSRAFFLVAVSLLTRMALFYMRDTVGLTAEQGALAVGVAGGLVLITNGLAAYPSGVLSDRVGRKTMIYVACALGFVGMLPLVFAQRDPAITLGPLAIGGGSLEIVYPMAGLSIILVGTGFGTFYAVDWALITDIIPKETTGRYMGISNVVTAMASPIALVVGGITAALFNEVIFGLGPRMAMLVAAIFYVLAALFLRPVDPRRWEVVHGAGPAVAPPDAGSVAVGVVSAAPPDPPRDGPNHPA
jgi:MFS family permease